MSLSSFFEHAFAMPGSGGPSPADIAQQQMQMLEAQQAKRDAAVAQGKTSIDDAFSQFNPQYFDNYKKTYQDAYNPQLADQYSIAQDRLVSALAGRDTLESSVGANALAQLQKTRDNAAVDIGNHATDASNGLRANVDQAKTNLYGLNAAAADPSQAASQARSSATAVVAPQAYPTMNDVFAGALAPFASGVKTNSQSMNPVFRTSGGGNSNGSYGSSVFG